MRSVLTILGISTLGLGVAPPGAAQEAAGQLSTARVAVIDMNRISSQSKLGQSYATKLEALENELKQAAEQKQAEADRMQADIETLQKELEKQRSVLSPEGLQKKGTEIRQKTRERQAFIEDGQIEIQRQQERARAQAQNLNNEFQLRLRPFIEAVAKEKGIDVLLSSEVAIAISAAYDISQDVIEKADAAEAGAAPGAASPPQS